MGNTYQPELWRDVYVVLGSSSAVLLGLLFIATSLHLDEIINQPFFHRRAFNNIRYLLITFVEAVFVLLPQPILILGVGLVAINLFALWLPLRITYLYFKSDKEPGHRGWTIFRAIIIIVSFLLGIAGGEQVLIGYLNWGIYLVAISCVTLIVMVVWNTWSIMLGISQSEKMTKTN